MFRDSMKKNKEIKDRFVYAKMPVLRYILVFVLTLSLVFTMAFGLTGCAESIPGIDNQNGDGLAGILPNAGKVVHAGNEVKYPSGLKYFVNNKLTTKNVTIELTDEEEIELFGETIENEEVSVCNISYIQIYGLKDIEVQNKVNDDLERICREHIGYLPPYRGAKAEFGENPKIGANDYYSVQENVFLSSNNILSVTVSVSASYKTDLSEWSDRRYIYFTDSYNVDLNTGEEIAINDIFCNDIDGMAYVNNVISEEIAEGTGDEEGWFYGGDLKINQPFKGIKPEQKFYLSISGLQVVLDYDTPEFDVGYGSYSVTIPYCDEMAVAERFYSEDENIYASAAPFVKSFPVGGYEYEYALDEWDSLNGWINTSRRATYPKGTPQAIKDSLIAHAEIPDEDIIDEFQPYYDEAMQQGDIESYWADAYNTSYANRIGDYLNVQYSEYRYMNYNPAHENKSVTLYHANNDKYQVYKCNDDMSEADEIRLDDIFAEDADKEKLIKKAIVEAINRGIDQRFEQQEGYLPEYGRFVVDGTSGDAERERLNKEFIDLVYENISGFSLNTDSLFVYVDVESENDLTGAAAVYEQVYGENPYEIEGGYMYVSPVSNLYYKDLGCDNLMIFE